MKLTNRIASASILGLALTGLALPAQAAVPPCTTLTDWVVVIVTPASPAVYRTEYEFVHKKAHHPNSPRWEAEGWNADSNPNSVGWASTGVTRQTLVTPATPEISHLEPRHTTVCPEVPPPPAPEPGPVVPPPAPQPDPAPPVPAPVPPAPVPDPGPAAPSAAPRAAVATVGPVADKAAPAAPAPVMDAPAELANTGAKEDQMVLTALLAGGILLAGVGLLILRRRYL